MPLSTIISEQNGQFRITIPLHIVKSLRLQPGDLLDWSITSSGTATLSKMIKVSAVHKGGL